MYIIEDSKMGKLILKGGNNRGIGKFVREYILKCVKEKKELDVKVLDGILLKKFGKGKSEDVNGSRVKSIRWYINDMKVKGLIEL